MRRILLVAFVLAAGFVVGTITPVFAASNYFAGYKYVTQLSAASTKLP